MSAVSTRSFRCPWDANGAQNNLLCVHCIFKPAQGYRLVLSPKSQPMALWGLRVIPLDPLGSLMGAVITANGKKKETHAAVFMASFEGEAPCTKDRTHTRIGWFPDLTTNLWGPDVLQAHCSIHHW